MSNNTNNTTSRLDRLLNNNKTQLATEVINLQDTLSTVSAGFEELESDYNAEVAKSSRLQKLLDTTEEADYELMDFDEIGKNVGGKIVKGSERFLGKGNDMACEIMEYGTGFFRRANRSAKATEEIDITNAVLKGVLKKDRIQAKISKDVLAEAKELVARAIK